MRRSVISIVAVGETMGIYYIAKRANIKKRGLITEPGRTIVESLYEADSLHVT